MFIRRLTGLVAICLAGGCLALPGAAQAAGSVVLTNASNGSSVTVGRGEQVTVQLTGSLGAGTQWNWSLPALSNAGVLTLVSEAQHGIYTTAVYRATGFGSTRVTSLEACHVTAPGHACPLYVLLWSVGVNVVVLDPPPPTA